MVRKTQVLLIRQLSTFFLLLLFAACGKDSGQSVILNHPHTGPALTTFDAEITLSESGAIQAKLFSKVLNHYLTPESYLEFPKGFRVILYDSAHRIGTTIVADYGKRIENTRIMEAVGNVVVRNELKNEQLNTEKLTWDERRRTIFTNSPVKITTPDKTLFGDGLESNETFTRYRFLNVHGQMLVKKDSI